MAMHAALAHPKNLPLLGVYRLAGGYYRP